MSGFPFPNWNKNWGGTVMVQLFGGGQCHPLLAVRLLLFNRCNHVSSFDNAVIF